MAKERKLDIFELLGHIDTCNKDYYSKMTEEQKKEFNSPVVAMRWLSTVGDKSGLAEYYLRATNHFVNKNFLELSKHPELQYKLMTCVGLGQKQRHQWIPFAKRDKKKNKVDILIERVYPDINEDELRIVKTKTSVDDFKQLCEDFGIDDKEIKEYVKEFKEYKKSE